VINASAAQVFSAIFILIKIAYMSQHIDSILLYELLRNNPVRCDPTLGVQLLNVLKAASPGAGDATLMSAEIQGEPIVIKSFPTDCPIKYLNGIKPRINSNIRDYGDYEPGTGLMLTENFIIPSITQNIVTCYNLSVCEYAYNVTKSMCSRNTIPPQPSYPIPTTDYCQIMAEAGTPNPLCPMNNTYNSLATTGTYETPSRDDTVRFMMVERCAGDIQGLIESYSGSGPSQILFLINNLYLMCLMVFHTLLLFDCMLNGYTHKDLGARNVLYTWDPHQSINKFWRYTFPSGTNFINIDIPTSTFIPKIWDFAYVRYGTANSYSQYYNYLNPIRVPDLTTLKYENREQNDVYVLLTDINSLLYKNGITGTIFNNLDLEKIGLPSNNTDAIYEFLSQRPIPANLLADPNHQIVHIFPPNNSVFDTLQIGRKVLNTYS
jgi:hypothetical protein